MVSSTEIIKETGLNRKTLWIWERKGIIAKGIIGTARSGRGKTRYWPDSVVPRIKRILEHLRQGLNLRSAVVLLGAEEFTGRVVLAHQLMSQVRDLADTKIDVTGATVQDFRLNDLFMSAIVTRLKPVLAVDLMQIVIARLTGLNPLALTMQLGIASWNPVLVIGGFDATEVKITSDIAVSHALADEGDAPIAVLPLLPLVERTFTAVGLQLPPELLKQKYSPAFKLQTEEGDEVAEYGFAPEGPAGCKIIRETRWVIGKSALSRTKT